MVLGKGCIRPKTSSPRAYQSMLVLEDLTYILVLYGIPKDFDLELPHPNTRVNSPLPGQLGVYEEAFEIGVRFSIPPFFLELLRFYDISLCTLIPSSRRLILEFLFICFIAKVWPSLILFHTFYTIKRYLYAKYW